MDTSNMVPGKARMPTEVWYKIFLETIKSWPGPSSDPICTPTGYSLCVPRQSGEVVMPPMVLSQVSGRWRCLISSMPRLWSSICVDIYRAGLKNDIFSLVETFLQKSASCPLTIELRDSIDEDKIDGMTPNGTIALGDAVFSLLVAEMKRCEVLCVLPSDGMVEPGRLSFPPDIALPILHKLNYGVSTFASDLPSHWIWDALSNAPQLAHIETIQFRDFLKLPTQRITSLTINRPRNLSLLTDLSQCTQLMSLIVNDFTTEFKLPGEEDTNRVSTPIKLPSIRNLSISFSTYDCPTKDATLFLNSITLPSLVALEISSWYVGGLKPALDWVWESLYSFLQRSSCTLQELYLKISIPVLPVSISFLPKILRTSPTLTTLTVELHEGHGEYATGVGVTTTCVSDLLSNISIATPHPAHGVLIPRLDIVRLRFHVHAANLQGTDIVNNILSFAESRSKQGLASLGMADRVSGLSELSLVFVKSPQYVRMQAKGVVPPFDRDALVPRLRQLTAGGMACTVDETFYLR